MAQPSSSHHGERHRERSSSHHHHRTISSTTLLLVLSLILAVLAVMLSLPSSSQSGTPGESSPGGILSALNPKRAQQLVSREAAVTVREAEVARREAELLAGAPGGIIPSPSPVLCPVCPSSTAVETIFAPAQTVIKEIVKEDSLTPPGWASPRVDEILDRELKVAERERDISKREENLNRREHDASRRESWIMEQLIALGNDSPAVEEEYYYEQPAARRKPAPKYQELPPLVVSEVQYETETQIVVQTQFVTVPPPASTRLAAPAAPEGSDPYSTASSPRTTSIEIITEEEEEYDDSTPVRVARSRPTRMPTGWFGGWN